MPKLIDLTGQKFHKLQVLKRAGNIGKKVAWECLCDCGNKIIVEGYSLKSGHTKSCGCLRGKDLTGQKFNRLTVIEKTEKRTKDRNVIWKCLCDCGKECFVDSSNLISNNTKSCGCLNTETRILLGKNNKKDLTGQIFGKLTVLEDSGKRYDNNILWKCQCECGNQPLIKGTSLLHGVKSCGCLKSKGEAYIAELLSKNNIPFETQKTFDDCLFPESGYHAYFDFWVDNKYLIEYDGIQHFIADSNSKNWNTEINLIETQKRDKFKNDWCNKKKIPLIRIPYTKLDTLCIEDLIYNQ